MYEERAKKAVDTRRKREKKKHKEHVRRGKKATKPKLERTLAVRPLLKQMKAESPNLTSGRVVCGETMERTLDHHHLDGDESNNDPDNIVTLCASCHRIIDKAKSANEIESDYQKRHLRVPRT